MEDQKQPNALEALHCLLITGAGDTETPQLAQQFSEHPMAAKERPKPEHLQVIAAN